MSNGEVLFSSGAMNHNAIGARVARYAPAVARFWLGAVFFVAGANGFLNFIPPPADPMPEGAMAFAAALMQTGYMLPLVKGAEVLAGALLLCNRFVPLALAILAPVVVNVFAFHLFLTPGVIGLAALLLAAEIYLAWAYRGVFRPMLAMRARPGS